MKRLALLITLIHTMTLPKTHAYWEVTISPETIVKQSQVSVGTYSYEIPNGGSDFVANTTYETNSIIIKEGIPYIVKDNKKCYDNKCPDPTTLTSPYDNPYKTTTLEWQASFMYDKNDIVSYNGKLYYAFQEHTASTNSPLIKGINGWIPVHQFEFSLDYYSPAGYYLYKGAIVKTERDIWQNEKNWHQYAISKTYTEQYSKTSQYSQGDAVFYNEGAYMVMDPLLANKNAPGTLYGAWNRIDSQQWQSYNLYKKGAVVFYKDKVYQAVVDYPNAIPATTPNTWNLLGEIKYQSNNTYKPNDIVIHNNIVYTALTTSTNKTPGQPGSETMWQR